MVTFDLRDITRVTRNLEKFADQIPFALARSLNDAAEIGMRRDLPTTWANSIGARDPNFIGQALSMKGTRATKKLLRVTVYDRFGRANLKLHDVGGRALPKRAAALAIPVGAIAAKRGAKGIPKRLAPGVLPNSFVTDGKRPNTHLKQGAIYQRAGQYHPKGSVKSRTGKRRKDKDGKLVAADSRTVSLAYVLKPSNPVRADVPFTATWEATMRREVRKAFKVRIREAMKTARR